MKIVINRNEGLVEGQHPIVTLDLTPCHYPYAIKKAIRTALELEGFDESTINEVFGDYPDKCKSSD